MQVDKIRQILRKIEALTDNLDDEGSTSSLERDLLLRYLRDVYEMVAAKGLDNTSPIRRAAETVRENSVPEIGPVTDHQVKVEATAEEPLPQELEVGDPAVTSNTLGVKSEDNHSPQLKPFSDSTKYFPPESEPMSGTPEVRKAQTPDQNPAQVIEADNAIISIFEFRGADDLASKLQNQPITSIESALGLNERLLTINTLFGGNPHNFNDALKAIQSMLTFEEARDYLVKSYATQFNWASDDKKQKATEFAQLVRRKFAGV